MPPKDSDSDDSEPDNKIVLPKRWHDMTPRERAMMGVQAQFDRYHKIARATGYTGHDMRLMSELKLLDASLGPPHSSTTSKISSPSSPPSSPSPSPPEIPALPQPSILATATFALTISPHYGNINNVLHGGAVALIMDMVTTAAIGPLAKKGYWEFLAGVTRTMSTNYLKSIPVGTLVHVHGHVMGLGKNMSFIKGFITSPDGKIVYVTCDVNKVGLPAKTEHMGYRVEWDEIWEDKAEGEGKAKL
ncbi:uncharacterized protein MKZ38_000999 [Zalerion maritima]|uniref:Thioesterase domain-containing protein n=1 Tax=Zalerion maritima TaxID=339359 RepID=A0AAD5WS91_9PEZI|nr:uncharacterized protein MKZ38_000999 [Zalerion maritima]